MAKVVFETFDMDARSRDMLIAARVICKAPLVITQGCYNKGGVAASAGTHDGGGAMDIRAKDLTASQILEVVSDLRHVGFAASHRLPSEGPWPEHVHCIAIGCPDLSRGAKNQVTAYLNGRNGLANNKADKDTRAWVDWTWERYKKTYPNLLVEDPDMTPDQCLKVITDYNHVLYGPKGTAGVWNARQEARDAALLSAVNAQGAATVAALGKLAAAVEKLAAAAPKA